MPDSSAAIEVTGLSKSFGPTRAVDRVDLVVPRGAIYGLLGPNGAGKTTVVRMLTTLLRPDAGTALIDGLDVVADARRVRTRIGLTGQYAAVEERLTGRENLTMIGRLHGLSRRRAAERSEDLLDRFDLGDAADRAAKGYSGGMRRRLDIAMSLIARPSVLFLDEPTTGLDPHSRMRMWELIAELEAEGTTVLLTTQYLDEADRLASAIVVIDHGRVIAAGTPDELKSQVGGPRMIVTIAEPTNAGRAADAITPFARGRIAIAPGGTRLETAVIAGERIVPEVIRALDDAGIDVLDVEVRRPTLDDVFLTLTGHGADGGANGGPALAADDTDQMEQPWP